MRFLLRLWNEYSIVLHANYTAILINGWWTVCILKPVIKGHGRAGISDGAITEPKTVWCLYYIEGFGQKYLFLYLLQLDKRTINPQSIWLIWSIFETVEAAINIFKNKNDYQFSLLCYNEL